jgi:predicted NACHT family NTPase
VGQGKSIFLRYLAARELTLGEWVPVFMELRRLTGTRSVADQVVEELKSLGLAHATREVFEALAASGHLVLLLDGFDEVDEARVSELLSELESLAFRWPNLRLVATSRPDSALEQFSSSGAVATG